MKQFLAQKLHIVVDGFWHVNEIIALAILCVLAVLAILFIFSLVKNIAEDVNPRKSTIFSHRKNKYKNRIGKKNKY